MRTYKVSCAGMCELSQIVRSEDEMDALEGALWLKDWHKGASATPIHGSFVVEEVEEL